MPLTTAPDVPHRLLSGRLLVAPRRALRV